MAAALAAADTAGVGVPAGAAGDDFLVNQFPGGQAPNVAMDADGDFVVVWARQSASGIIGRRFDASGIPAGNEFVVAQGADGDRAEQPQVAMDADGDFVVAWRHKNFAGFVESCYTYYGYEYCTSVPTYDGSAVVARRYDAAGVPMGAVLEVAPLASDFPREPVVAADADGDFAVAWFADQGNVSARLFGADGLPRGDAFTVAQSVDLPALDMDADGDFVIAWVSTVDQGTHARAYAADGAPKTDAFRVDDGTAQDARVPAVALDADGDFLVAWNARISPYCPYPDPYGYYCPNSPEFAVRARRFGADGTPQGTEFELEPGEREFPTRRHHPQVTMAADGVAVVTLHRSAKRVDLDGSLHPGPVFSQVADLLDFNVASDADGDYALTRVHNSNVLARRFAGHESLNLSLSMAGDPGPVDPGDTVTYLISVTNLQPAPALSGDPATDAYLAATAMATGVAVTFSPPTGADGIQGVGTDWACAGTAPLTCRYGPKLAPGASTSVEVTLSAPSFGPEATATATVAGDQFDADASNDQAAQVTQVSAPPPDTAPDAFAFVDQSGVTLNTQITSNSVAITGINTAAAISVTGGSYSIDGGTFTSAAGTVTDGQMVQVRHTSSASFSTATDTVLTVGGVSDTFTSTTAAAPDTIPDAFTFIDQTGVARNTQITSNSVTITGINTAAAISVTGGSRSYSIDGGAFTSASGTVTNGQMVQVRHTSSANFSTATNTALNVGGVSDIFTSTTAAAPPSSPTSRGGSGGLSLTGLLVLALAAVRRTLSARSRRSFRA